MNILTRKATLEDASVAAELVTALTTEICEKTGTSYFDYDRTRTIQLCKDLISKGHYTVFLAYSGGPAVGVATITETYALYAGGLIGSIQEFYIVPEVRSQGVGGVLLESALAYGKTEREWAAVELCTPPLPEFSSTIDFYNGHGLTTVGGRKMRMYFSGTTDHTLRGSPSFDRP